MALESCFYLQIAKETDGQFTTTPGFVYISKKNSKQASAALEISSAAPQFTGDYTVDILVNDGERETLYEHKVSVIVRSKCKWNYFNWLERD